MIVTTKVIMVNNSYLEVPVLTYFMTVTKEKTKQSFYSRHLFW